MADRVERTTIHTVARLAGVSPATVSRVLNGKNLVAPATRDRVLRAIEKSGFYEPSRVARALRAQRSRIIGVLVENVINPFYSVLARAICDAAKEADYAVVLSNDDGSETDGAKQLEVFESLGVAGVIMTPWAGVGCRREIALRLAARGTAVVVVGDTINDPEFDLVGIDLGVAAKEVVQYLIQQGHQRIGYVGPTPTTDRFVGYQKALQEAGLPTYALFLPGAPTASTLSQAVQKEVPGFVRGQGLSALIAHSDFYALEILRIGTLTNLRIPDELSVVGFDDIPFACLTSPPLTTVHVPEAELGKLAVDAVCRRLEAPTAAEHSERLRLILPTRLVVRGSVKNIAQGNVV